MPEVRYYEVTQTRKVKVVANSPEDAAVIASSAFTNGQDANGRLLRRLDGVWGDTSYGVFITGLRVETDY